MGVVRTTPHFNLMGDSSEYFFFKSVSEGLNNLSEEAHVASLPVSVAMTASGREKRMLGMGSGHR